MTQVILGQCPSKSNGYRIGNKMLFKTKTLTDYEKQFYLQCNHYRDLMIDEFFELQVDAYFRTSANDLDGIFKILLDCLAKCKAIKNDNLCTRITARKFKDAQNPRIEFSVKKI